MIGIIMITEIMKVIEIGKEIAEAIHLCTREVGIMEGDLMTKILA